MSLLAPVLGGAACSSEPPTSPGGDGGGQGCSSDADCKGDRVCEDRECVDGESSPPPACEPGAVEACYTGLEGTEGVGACKSGQRTCSADGAGFGPCEGEVTPEPETCATTTDDDCDGLTNEEGVGCACAPDSIADCYDGPAGTAGVGECLSGTQACNGLGTGYGPCTSQVLPSPEICDSIDNDCDGEIDDGFAVGSACQGACGEGVIECSDSGVAVCSTDAGGTQDYTQEPICTTGLYGQLPDGTIGPDGQCHSHIPAQWGWVTCGQTWSVSLLHRRPKGACATREICQASSGVWQCSADLGPLPELCCNGLDDDGDGVVDESCPTLGACEAAVPHRVRNYCVEPAFFAKQQQWLEALCAEISTCPYPNELFGPIGAIAFCQSIDLNNDAQVRDILQKIYYVYWGTYRPSTAFMTPDAPDATVYKNLSTFTSADYEDILENPCATPHSYMNAWEIGVFAQQFSETIANPPSGIDPASAPLPGNVQWMECGIRPSSRGSDVPAGVLLLVAGLVCVARRSRDPGRSRPDRSVRHRARELEVD